MLCGTEKARMVWLPDGEKILKICLFCTNVTDTHTDGHTHTPHDSIDRACIASHGKNCPILMKFGTQQQMT